MLQTRVDLGIGIIRPVRAPLVAHAVKLVFIMLGNAIPQVVRPLEEVDRQTARHVPSNVAMEEPGTRVVGAEGEQQPAAGREHGDVTTGRVLPAQAVDVGGWVEVVALVRTRRDVGGSADNEEVVALERGQLSERRAKKGGYLR